MECQGSTELETTTHCAEITTTGESLETSTIFHIITEVSGFVLYMHQQIPSVLQQITLEFNTLCEELEGLEAELAQALEKASLRRKCMSQMREIRQGIRRFERLMRCISEVEKALKVVISEVPGIERVVLALGASPMRPQHIYELSFSPDRSLPVDPPNFDKTRAADAISKRAIRALISKGAGSGSYQGTSKLYLLVKAPLSFSQPLHFLPKRDFRYNKKIVPFRVHFKSKNNAFGETIARDPDLVGSAESTLSESIWFQCRHVIKGLPFNVQPEE